MKRLLALPVGAAMAAVFACSSGGGTSSGSDAGFDAVSHSSSGSGSSSGTTSSSSGSGSGSTSGSASSSASSGGSSSGGSSGGISCSSADPYFCACFHGGAANATPCGPSALQQPGACCADVGWPSTGSCQCASFTCDVNAGGGYDCWYHSGDANHTTSATGAVCCVRQGICSCYDTSSAGQCQGYTSVASCTASTTPPCTDPVTQGTSVVPTCR